MFRESLLESAPGVRRRKRWPMVLAVALEVTVCSLLVALPLFSTGIIPVSASTPPVILPKLDHVRITQEAAGGSPGNPGHTAPVPPTQAVVAFGDSRRVIEPITSQRDDDEPLRPDIRAAGQDKPLKDCQICLDADRRPPQQGGPVSVSGGVSEGYLMHRVEPVYPHIALVTGTRGEVRLHAIISKDGVIERLTLISGHPLLARAAMEAVQQWRYRPYLLNKEPVEVETFITVNFNPSR